MQADVKELYLNKPTIKVIQTIKRLHIKYIPQFHSYRVEGEIIQNRIISN